MMASDDKKTKTESVQKSEAPTKSPKSDAPAKEAPAKEASAKKEGTSGAEPAKDKSAEVSAESPSNYSRGEGQKPVSKAYKENWNAIFAKKKKKR
jgi:hypothetical protein